MPQILDDYLQLVFYVYESQGAAESASPKPDTGGTGFFIVVPFSEGTDDGSFYAVTAAHVVKDHASSVLRLNSRDGHTKTLAIARNEWVLHPGGDDLAVAPIRLDDSQFQIFASPPAAFLTDDVKDHWAMGPGDEVFIVGRFVNHEGVQRNTPTVRFGNIAMMPQEPIHNGEMQTERPAYLIETRSQCGYSGSPVFVYVSAGTPRLLPGREKQAMLTGGPWLLGVLWGYTKNETQLRGYPQVFQTGLAAVVPISSLSELLGADRLVQLHQRAETEWKSKMQAAPVQPANEKNPGLRY